MAVFVNMHTSGTEVGFWRACAHVAAVSGALGVVVLAVVGAAHRYEVFDIGKTSGDERQDVVDVALVNRLVAAGVLAAAVEDLQGDALFETGDALTAE